MATTITNQHTDNYIAAHAELNKALADALSFQESADMFPWMELPTRVINIHKDKIADAFKRTLKTDRDLALAYGSDAERQEIFILNVEADALIDRVDGIYLGGDTRSWYERLMFWTK